MSQSNRDDDSSKAELVVDSVESLAEVRSKRARELEISVLDAEVSEEKLNQLRGILERHPGKLGVVMNVRVGDRGSVTMSLPENLKVDITHSDALIRDINVLFDRKNAAEVG